MSTKVLVFESDTAFAQELQSGLTAYDCEVTLVDDASIGLQTAARDRPDLILLAIELPRMNGFSVCNKLKRDPGLKDVPLIIMSSDSTDETFEQHRRLRTRAEEYVHKPIAFDDLLGQIQTFVELGKPSAVPASNGEEAIVIEEDIEIEEEGRVEVDDAELEIETDKLTERAFDSMLEFPRAAAGSPGDVAITDADMVADLPPMSFEEVGTGEFHELGEAELDSIEIADAEVLPEHSGNAASDEAPIDSVSMADAGSYDGLLADPFSNPPPLPSQSPGARISSEPGYEPPAKSEVPRRQSSLFPRLASSAPLAGELDPRLREEIERHRARVAQLEDEGRAAQARITELEDAVRRGASKDHEVQRLQRELDEAKTRAAVGKSSSSTAREFLDLREQLNKKDKELIDLRDQITHRDKELLGLRDGSLSLEREKADLHDRVVELERQSTELTRANEAFKNDKEAASKRAEDFKRKSEKLKADLDAKLAEYAELKTLYDSELASRTVREAEFESRAQADLETAVLATEASERQRAEQALEAARAEAAAVMEAQLNRERENAAENLRAALEARENELNAEHESKTLALERAGVEALGKLRMEHEQALVEADQVANARLIAREAELEEQRLREIDNLRKELGDQIAARDRTVEGLERELSTRTAERDDLRRDGERRSLKLEGLATDLATVREELDETRTALSDREARLSETQEALAAKTGEASGLLERLERAESRLMELEAAFGRASADLESTREALTRDHELLARARAKWDGDRTSLERTKDALAAALQQIDEIEARALE